MGNSDSRSVKLARFQPLNSHILQRDDICSQKVPKNCVIPQLKDGQILLRSTQNGTALQSEGTFSGKQTQRFINQALSDPNPEFSSLCHESVKSEEAYLGGSPVEQGFIASRKAYSDPDIVHGMLNWHRLLQAGRSETENIYNSRSLIALSPNEAKIMFRKKTQESGQSYSSSLPRDFDSVRYTNNKRNACPFISHKKSLFSKLRKDKGEKRKGFSYILKTPVIPTPDYSTESDGDENDYESQKACIDSRMRNIVDESMKSKIKRTLHNLDEKEPCFKVRDKSENETCPYISTSSKNQTKHEAFNNQVFTEFSGNGVYQNYSDYFVRNQSTTFSENQTNQFLETKRSPGHFSLLKNDFPIKMISKATTEKSVVPLETELISPLITNTDDKATTLHSANKPELQICYGKLQCDYPNSGIANKLVNLKHQQRSLTGLEDRVTEENNFSPKYDCDIYFSWKKERSNNEREKKLYEDQPEFSLTAARAFDNSSLSGEEDVKIIVKLKPTLPRRQLHQPRFSPAEVWRSLCSDIQKSGEESEGEEEIPEVKLDQINIPVAPSRIVTDGCGDSGVPPDAGKPASVNDTSQGLFSDSKREENIQSARDVTNPLTCNGQHHSLHWTLAQDLDDNWTPEQDLDDSGSEKREVEVFALSEISIQPKLTFLNNICSDYNLSRQVREPNRIYTPHYGSPKPMLHKYFEKHKKSNKKRQENFSSLRNLKKTIGFQDKFPVTHSNGNIDSNWNLRLSVPDNIDKAGTSDIWNLEHGHFERRHPGSLFVENSDKILQPRKSLSENKHKYIMPSIECDATCVENYKDLAKDSVVQKDDKKIFFKKKKKFTFQNTFRREERLRLENKLINEISEKEELREAEIDWLNKVEEEFRKQRDNNKNILCSQLRFLNQHPLEKYEVIHNYSSRNQLRPESQSSSYFPEHSGVPINIEKNKKRESENSLNKSFIERCSFSDPEEDRRIKNEHVEIDECLRRNQKSNANITELEISKLDTAQQRSTDKEQNGNQLKPFHSELVRRELDPETDCMSNRKESSLFDIFHSSKTRQVRNKLEQLTYFSPFLYLPQAPNIDEMKKQN